MATGNLKQPDDELQRQVDELLRQMEQRRRRGWWWRQLGQWRRWVNNAGHWLTRYAYWPRSPGELMLASLVMVVASAVLTPFLPTTGYLVGVTGVVLFLLAFATSFMRPSATDREVRWRGRVVKRRSTPWWERFYRLLYQRRWR